MWSFLVLIFFLYPCQALFDDKWWQHNVIYQIYPRSFKDSNGDGIGDLKGATSKLDYLKELGIGTIWLSATYPSPKTDFDSDVTDYYNIHPEVGTMTDFQEFLYKAKSLGLKVIMDFIPNHSSIQHDWFKNSVRKNKPYDEFYIWRDAKIVNNTRTPPNNWLSSHGGSAWEWNSQRNQYYLHQFAISQADLNYYSSSLRKEMENVLRFWVDKGVNGFRVDSMNYLVEDSLFREEPRSGKLVPSTDPDYLDHIYTQDQRGTFDIVVSWRDLLNLYARQLAIPEIVTFSEAYTNVPSTMKYYTSGSSFPINMYFTREINGSSSAGEVKKNIYKWLNNIPGGHVANWLIGNHNHHRVNSRMGGNRGHQLVALAMLLPGVPMVYNGDEIGMTDTFLTFNQTLDPVGCQAGPEGYQQKSRDPARTPFQWDNSTSAGFSSNNKTWLPVNENYRILNLKAQMNSSVSQYAFFKSLSLLRKTQTVFRGSLEIILATEKVLGVVRRLMPSPPVVLLLNTSNSTVTVDASMWLNIPEEMNVYAASEQLGTWIGKRVDTTKLVLPAGISLVFSDLRV